MVHCSTQINHPTALFCRSPPHNVCVVTCDRSTFRGIHASDGEHGPDCGFSWPRAGALKQGPALGQEVILHAFHEQPLALHAVPEQRVGLQICQELHKHKQGHVTAWKKSSVCVCVFCQ